MVNPVMVTPVPETAAVLMVTLVVPAFCSLIVCEFVVPTITLVNVADAGVAVMPDCTPVPVMDTVVTAGVALLVREIVPLERPATVGANTALKFALEPAPTEIGSVNPLTEYPVPDAESAVTVSVAFPRLLIVMIWVADPFTATFEKGTGLGVTEICGTAAATPVPDMGTTSVAGDALLESEILPFERPAVAGAK